MSVPLIVREPIEAAASASPDRPNRNPPCLKLIYTNATTGGSTLDSGFITATMEGGLVEVSHYAGTTYVTYEVADSDPKVLHEARIGFYVAFITNTAMDLPALGTSTFSVGFMPGPTDVVSDESAPRNAFTIYSAQSFLLFPFVTSREGFDTRITIANTSIDPFGTTEQKGSVALFFFDNSIAEGAPPFTRCITNTIRGGHVLVFDLSTGGKGVLPRPDFEGYIIAVTNFMYAHALAFISHARGGGAGHSYSAVHIPGMNGGLAEPPGGR